MSLNDVIVLYLMAREVSAFNTLPVDQCTDSSQISAKTTYHALSTRVSRSGSISIHRFVANVMRMLKFCFVIPK